MGTSPTSPVETLAATTEKDENEQQQKQQQEEQQEQEMESMRGRRRGIVSKLKVDLNNFDFNIVEITESNANGKVMSVLEALEATNINNDSNNDSSNGNGDHNDCSVSCPPTGESLNVWYCDAREFGRNVQLRDEVDFVSVPGTCIAVDVKVKPTFLGPGEDIPVFRRTVFN